MAFAPQCRTRFGRPMGRLMRLGSVLVGLAQTAIAVWALEPPFLDYAQNFAILYTQILSSRSFFRAAFFTATSFFLFARACLRLSFSAEAAAASSFFFFDASKTSSVE